MVRHKTMKRKEKKSMKKQVYQEVERFVFEPPKEKESYALGFQKHAGEREIIFSNDSGWIMKIGREKSGNKISFNRDAFPDLAANDFAEEVLKILEYSGLRRKE